MSDDTFVGNVPSDSPGSDLLIEGANYASTLNGGAGEDILIGGTTDYDINQAALRAILAEWANNHTISLLDADTVHSNGMANQLTGGTSTDLFFARLATELLDLDLLSDTSIPL